MKENSNNNTNKANIVIGLILGIFSCISYFCFEIDPLNWKNFFSISGMILATIIISINIKKIGI